MTKINPERLKYHRKLKHLSMDKLVEASGINKSTIQRIENGKKSTSTREHTISQLATALGVTSSELTDPKPIEKAAETKDVAAKTQINIRIGTDARNALAFVATRYDVKQTTILRLAPLLFALIAEESLFKRTEQLAKLIELGNALGAIPKAMEQSMMAFHNQEAASIKSRDIFGKLLDDEDIQQWQHTDYADHVGIYNPLALHIHQRLAEVGSVDELMEWNPDIGPEYHAGAEVALELADGEEEIASMLTSGSIGLHEMPPELRLASNLDMRMQWLRQKRDQVIEDRNAPNPFRKKFNLTVAKETGDA